MKLLEQYKANASVLKVLLLDRQRDLFDLHSAANAIIQHTISMEADLRDEGYASRLLFLVIHPSPVPGHRVKPVLHPMTYDKSSKWTYFSDPKRTPEYQGRGHFMMNKAMPLLGVEVARTKIGDVIGLRHDEYDVSSNTLVVPRSFIPHITASTKLISS